MITPRSMAAGLGLERRWQVDRREKPRAPWFLVATVLVAPFLNSLADTARLTTWNLAGLDTNTAAVQQAAETLKSLNPDIILLQGVRDWQMCGQLAEALRPPEYHVLICSSFRDARASTARNEQVAILSRHKAYFSWSEPWRAQDNTGGGFAFIALQIGGQRLGLFSATLPGQGASPAAVQQMLGQVNAIRQWEANRVQSFVIALSFGGAAPAQPPVVDKVIGPLQEAGFTDVFQAGTGADTSPRAEKPPKTEATTEFLLAQATVFPVSPQLAHSPVATRAAVTCDLELDPLRVAAAWTASAQELARRSALKQQREEALSKPALIAPNAEAAQPGVGSAPAWWWPVEALMLFSLAVSIWLIARRTRPGQPRSPALLSSSVEGDFTTSSYTVLLAPPPGTAAQTTATALSDGRSTPGLEMPVIQTQSGNWEQRALAAERTAQQAGFLLRHKLLGSLTLWLKEKFVRKLISDRSQLLEAQEGAALKAMNVDERLGRIEKQIQQQTQTYERTIEELTRELLAAREENRELIRARIAQLKLEMETVRARLRAEAQQQMAAPAAESP